MVCSTPCLFGKVATHHVKNLSEGDSHMHHNCSGSIDYRSHLTVVVLHQVGLQQQKYSYYHLSYFRTYLFGQIVDCQEGLCLSSNCSIMVPSGYAPDVFTNYKRERHVTKVIERNKSFNYNRKIYTKEYKATDGFV